jgi:hypothetical protein
MENGTINQCNNGEHSTYTAMNRKYKQIELVTFNAILYAPTVCISIIHVEITVSNRNPIKALLKFASIQTHV